MAILPLVQAPDSRLNSYSVEIDTFDNELKQLLNDIAGPLNFDYERYSTEALLPKVSSGIGTLSLLIFQLFCSMLETLRASGGIGLAAVQVGVLKRVFVLDVHREWVDPLPGYRSTGQFFIINPRITHLSDQNIPLNEGCLSLKEQGHQNEITRPRYLTLKYLDYRGTEQLLRADGWLARCIQHELDHLNGVIFLKHLLHYF